MSYSSSSHHQPDEEDNAPQNEAQWLVTFSDLLALIITFFVLIYSMSSVSRSEWEELSSSLAQRLDPDKVLIAEPQPTVMLSVNKIDRPKAQGLDYLYAIITDKMSDSNALSSAFELQQLGDRLIISLSGHTMFDPGETVLTKEAARDLALLGDVLRSIGNEINVYGNASPSPIDTPAFPSNWELSTSRALVVARALRSRGYVYRITAFGRSDANYRSLTPEKSERERKDLARRVDIVIRDTRAE